MPGYTLTLRQVTGRNPLTVTLLQSTLPEKDLEEKYGLAYVKSYYPGMKDPTFQILNVLARPIRFSGLISDKEARATGYADIIRQQLRRLMNEPRRMVLEYRTLTMEGFMTSLEFFEEDEYEVRYEIEFDPIRTNATAPTAPLRRPGRDVAPLSNALTDFTDRWSELEAQQPEPPPYQRVSLDAIYAEYPEYPTMDVWALDDLPATIRTYFELDPFLEARLQAEAIQESLREMLRLAGNERLLNMTDRVSSAAAAALRAANRTRTAVEGIAGAGSIPEALGQAATIGAVLTSIDSIRLAL